MSEQETTADELLRLKHKLSVYQQVAEAAHREYHREMEASAGQGACAERVNASVHLLVATYCAAVARQAQDEATLLHAALHPGGVA